MDKKKWEEAKSHLVSMKSGLEGRNNHGRESREVRAHTGLNEVRPRRPEQFGSNSIDSCC